MKDYVKENMEEKGIEVLFKTGRPNKLNSKRNLTEEQRDRERKTALKCYYKHKAIAVQ